MEGLNHISPRYWTTRSAHELLDEVTPQLWHDVTPQQRLKCKEMDGGTNVMITYDATKMDGAYSDGISSITPLFHQIFMNVRGFCIC